MRIRISAGLGSGITVSKSQRISKALPGVTLSWWIGRLFGGRR